MYALIVPPMDRTLGSLSKILTIAEAHCTAKNIKPEALLNFRMFPDMLPLSRQVQIATDMSKGGAARLAGVEVPKWDDNETTLDDLQARINKALAYLAAFTPAQFEAAASRAIEVKTPSRSYQFNGQDFLSKWSLPNFYFHLTTAYNLLRHNGVPLGKMDFLAID